MDKNFLTVQSTLVNYTNVQMSLRFNGMWKPHNHLFIIMYLKPHNYLFIIIEWKPHNHILIINYVLTLCNIMAANYDTWNLCLTTHKHSTL